MKLRFEVAVGRRHDPHVHANRPLASDAPHLPIFQNAQQLDLNVRRQLADLIQEDGPAMSHFKITTVRAGGAGKSTLFVSEELRLEEAFRKRAAVDGQKWTLRSRALRVNGASQPLLADAGLTKNQKRAVGVHHPTGERQEALHRRARVDEIVQALPLARPVGPNAPHRIIPAAGQKDAKRFGQHLVGQAQPQHGQTAGCEQACTFCGVFTGPDDDDLRMIGKAANRGDQVCRQLGTVARAEHHEVGILMGQALPQAGASGRLGNFHAGRLEQPGQSAADGRGIDGQEDPNQHDDSDRNYRPDLDRMFRSDRV